jgi:iron complex transport system substrate-binding protein
MNHLKMKSYIHKLIENRRLFGILCIGVVVFCLTVSCDNPKNTQNDENITINDILGRQVVIPKNVKKVVGIRAGALRLLLYMDVGDKIAGIEQNEKKSTTPYMVTHHELTELPSIGPSMGGDAELILKVRPDVIFSSYTTVGDADALQKKTGIPVVAIECTEFATAKDTLFASLKLIGKIMRREGRADSLISYLENSIVDLGIRTSNIPETQKTSVYVGGIGYSGVYGINSTNPYFPPFMFVNANNVTDEINPRLISHVKGTFVDKEQLIIWNPDFIFIDVTGWDIVKNDLSENKVVYNQLDAVKNNNLFTLLPHNNYATNYEYVLANAWYVGKILYPDKFEDININNKFSEILFWFLGSDTIDEQSFPVPPFNRLDNNDE